MTLDAIRNLGDYAGFIFFTVTFVVVLVARRAGGNELPRPTKVMMLAAIGIYVLVTGSDAAGRLGLTSFIEPIEDHLETLFPVLAIGAVFSAYAARQYADLTRTQQALQQSHSLMMDVVDAAPAGIVFLDTTGHIAFANDTARDIMDLDEDAVTGVVAVPDWVMDGGDGDRPGNLIGLVSAESYSDRDVVLRWPTGWIIALRVSARPLSDDRGEVGGVVITFARPLPTAVRSVAAVAQPAGTPAE
ncbi:MAG: PAS domain-containing protein [Coriobacteriia bacterium]|nr:PAS domain-containing protein [Coriobacteriia bacterium]